MVDWQALWEYFVQCCETVETFRVRQGSAAGGPCTPPLFIYTCTLPQWEMVMCSSCPVTAVLLSTIRTGTCVTTFNRDPGQLAVKL